MKVLMIGPSKDSMGGIATVIKNFHNTFSEDDVQLYYLTSWKEGNVYSRYFYSLMFYFKLVYQILILNIDIIHIHVAQRGSFYRKSLGVFLSKILRKKVILHIHGSHFDVFYNNSNDTMKKYISKTLNAANLIIVLSEEWKKFVSEITNSQIIVLHNAVEVSEYNYNNNGKNITFLGRLGQRKGIYDLLDVIEDFNFNKYPIKFYLCGDGDIEEIKSRLKVKNLCENVIVTGWLDKEEKQKILEHTIINLLPSYHEGMPMAILETMALGVPNISTTVGGIPQVIVNEENGLLIEPGNQKELCNAIIRLLEHEDLRKNLSMNAFKTINTEYSISIYNKKIVSIYFSLVKGIC